MRWGASRDVAKADLERKEMKEKKKGEGEEGMYESKFRQ